MEMWTEVRRRVLTGELSKRAACQEYGINWRTLGKMLAHAEPPGYRRRAKREKPILGPHLAWIHEVLEQDKKAPKKQHHTAQRIFDRLKAERDYTGGVTMVKAAVREWKDARKEVFVPLSHPPGEAQVDFGFAYVDIAGERQQVALFVMTLPYSDSIFIQAFPRECTEAFLEGHNRSFRFIGGVPRKIRYDNSKIAVAKITGSRERQVTREFQRLQSHYLFDTQFCLVRRANEKGHVECLVDFGRANFLVPVPSVESLADRSIQVLLGDSMGEMAAYYAASDIAFVGGSLLPLGGQNLIEPCALGRPVLVGPHTFNFREVAAQAIEAGAAIRVADPAALAHEAERLFGDPAARAAMGEAGAAFARHHRGATARTIDRMPG